MPFILTPLNLILGYTLIGIIAAFFSPRDKFPSVWWAIMFVSPVLVLMVIPPQYLYFIINLNWIIASLLTLGIMVFFLTRPNVLKNITINSFFASSIRPFEGWLGIRQETGILDLVGTRPTGLGRYSAIASLIALSFFINYPTWYWLLTFLVITFVLLFSKGKTEILAFIISMGFLLFTSHNLLSLLTLAYIVIIVLSYIIIFGNVPYIIPNTIPKKSRHENTEETATVEKISEKTIIAYSDKSFLNRLTSLGGRINGVWKNAICLIKQRPIIGWGFGIERFLLKDYQGNPASVDSTVLNALLQSGFLGTLMFLGAIVWTVYTGYQMFMSGNQSLIFLEASSVGIFILLRGITQSFSNYSADWLFLVPIIAYLILK